jgi:hypothetical protein
MPQVHRSPCTAVAGRSFCESGIFGYGGAEWTRCGRCTSPLFDAWVLTCLKQEMGHNHREQTQLVDQHPNIDHSMTIFGMRRRGFQGFEWFWAISKCPTFWMFEPYTFTRFLDMNVKNGTFRDQKREPQILSWLGRSPNVGKHQCDPTCKQIEFGLGFNPTRLKHRLVLQSLLDMSRSWLGGPIARAPFQPKDKVVPFLKKWLYLVAAKLSLEVVPFCKTQGNSGDLSATMVFSVLVFFLRSGWL